MGEHSISFSTKCANQGRGRKGAMAPLAPGFVTGTFWHFGRYTILLLIDTLVFIWIQSCESKKIIWSIMIYFDTGNCFGYCKDVSAHTISKFRRLLLTYKDTDGLRKKKYDLSAPVEYKNVVAMFHFQFEKELASRQSKFCICIGWF